MPQATGSTPLEQPARLKRRPGGGHLPMPECMARLTTALVSHRHAQPCHTYPQLRGIQINTMRKLDQRAYACMHA
eukprot:151317-Chlamydomonas_euryale.AAC.1